jgi:hypothetical protein
MVVRLAALVLLTAAAPYAAAVNKCVDPAGRVTYTSLTCEKEGLKPAGAVRDRMTIMPVVATPAALSKQGSQPRERGEDEIPLLPTVKPISPAIDLLLK